MDSTRVDSLRIDSLPKWQEKKDTVLNLRTADTTELKLIHGIGSYRAKQIVHYRQALGGFTRVEQLLEVNGLLDAGDSLLTHFMLDSVIVEPIYINSVTTQRLAQHPYLRFEQAKAIYELRRKKVRLTSTTDLEQLDCLDTTTINKLAPYLNFDKKKP